MPSKLSRKRRREQTSTLSFQSVKCASTTATPFTVQPGQQCACHPTQQPTSCCAPSTDSVLQKLASLLSQPTVSPQPLLSTNQDATNSALVQLLNDLKLHLQRFEAKLDAIKEEQKRQGQQLEDLFDSASPTSSTTVPSFCFPLRRMRDFDRLESSLNDPQTKETIMKFLAGFKASSVPDLVRLYLKQVLGPYLRQEFTYSGTRGKRCFHITQVYMLIQECAACDPNHQPPDRLLIIDSMRKWFYDAKGRIPGVAFRKKPRCILPNDENGHGASPEDVLVVKPDAPAL